MEVAKKEVVRSAFYLGDLQDIFRYGVAVFEENAANYFYDDLRLLVRRLETEYEIHPEFRNFTCISQKPFVKNYKIGKTN